MAKNRIVTKKVLVGIVIFFVVICSLPILSSINTETQNLRIVSSDQNMQSSSAQSRGTILYVGGGGPGNYSRIQDAVDNASTGDTIVVYDDSSPYFEHIVIDTTLILLGENSGTTIIDGNDSGDVISIVADGVFVSGFTLQHGGGGQHGAGIVVGSEQATIKGNRIINNDYGVYLLSTSSHTLISRNTIVNQYGGVSLLSTENNTVTENIIMGNAFWGVYLEFSSYNKISWNTLMNQGHGVYLGSSSYNTISWNEITNNAGGIYCVFSTNNYLMKNIISNNPYGIDYESSSDNIACGNTISHSSQYGIHLIMSSDNNLFYHNNLLSNTMNAYDEGVNSWDNGYPSGGNYWDTYHGSDADHDGIGDTPYPIPGGSNLDWYPLMDLWAVTRCGDLTHDSIIDVADVVFLLNYLYKNGPAPDPLCSGEITGDGIIDVADIVYLLNYLYKNGPMPRDDCCPC